MTASSLEGDDRRRYRRFPLSVPCYLITPKGGRIDGSIRDISRNGVYMRSEDLLPAGSECTLVVLSGPGTEVEVSGHVLRAESDGMALDFRSLDGASFERLQDLILSHMQ